MHCFRISSLERESPRVESWKKDLNNISEGGQVKKRLIKTKFSNNHADEVVNLWLQSFSNNRLLVNGLIPSDESTP